MRQLRVRSGLELYVSSSCPLFLHLASLLQREEQLRGLCDGRLFSCMGHFVPSSLPDLALSGESTAIIMMRNPWKRLQSDFHYIRSRPQSGHLGPNINMSSAISSLNSTFDFALYPGIANCATKVSTLSDHSFPHMIAP